MKKVVLFFLTWKFFIFFLLIFSLSTITLQFDYLGGGLKNYLGNPYLWPYVNFDGVHYLSIAIDGYRPLTYFYFPFFPLVLNFFANIFGDGSFFQTANVGIIINNIFFILGLFGLYKLTGLDFPEKISKYAIILLLLFPTSFFFTSLYNESLFLALIVWSFYFARKKKWIIAAVLGILATSTRVVGIALLPALLVEVYLQWKKSKKSMLIPALSAMSVALGTFVYMWYLDLKTNDPLIFIHSVDIFGQQRSSSLVALPQVFYRYIFKIIPNLNYNFFPVVFSTFLELGTALVFGALAVLSFIKLRTSYAIYFAGAYLIPTLSGSFSSLPRYVLVLFPAFILSAFYISKFKKPFRIFVYFVLLMLLTITAPLFFRGFWIS